MIQENELRKNNWFYFPFHNQYIQILGYALMETDNTTKVQFKTNGLVILEPISVLNPIALTPEILEKCGFKIRPTGGYCKKISNNFEFYILTLGNMDEFYLLQFDSAGIMCPCKYLHQLQNLYLTLTGEELNPNL